MCLRSCVYSKGQQEEPGRKAWWGLRFALSTGPRSLSHMARWLAVPHCEQGLLLSTKPQLPTQDAVVLVFGIDIPYYFVRTEISYIGLEPVNWYFRNSSAGRDGSCL